MGTTLPSCGADMSQTKIARQYTTNYGTGLQEDFKTEFGANKAMTAVELRNRYHLLVEDLQVKLEECRFSTHVLRAEENYPQMKKQRSTLDL